MDQYYFKTVTYLPPFFEEFMIHDSRGFMILKKLSLRVGWRNMCEFP